MILFTESTWLRGKWRVLKRSSMVKSYPWVQRMLYHPGQTPWDTILVHGPDLALDQESLLGPHNPHHHWLLDSQVGHIRSWCPTPLVKMYRKLKPTKIAWNSDWSTSCMVCFKRLNFCCVPSIQTRQYSAYLLNSYSVFVKLKFLSCVPLGVVLAHKRVDKFTTYRKLGSVHPL